MNEKTETDRDTVSRMDHLQDALLDDLASQLSFCIGNIIHDLVMGHHYEYNDPVKIGRKMDFCLFGFKEFLHFKGLLDHVVKDVSGVPMPLIICQLPYEGVQHPTSAGRQFSLAPLPPPCLLALSPCRIRRAKVFVARN